MVYLPEQLYCKDCTLYHVCKVMDWREYDELPDDVSAPIACPKIIIKNNDVIIRVATCIYLNLYNLLQPYQEFFTYKDEVSISCLLYRLRDLADAAERLKIEKTEECEKK